MTIEEILIDPFVQYGFMRRALVACLALALGGAPLGFFMNQRRMALVADAMSHAILPGVAVAFLVSGMGVWALTLGGLTAGVLVALLAVLLIRRTRISEDGAFTLLFLLCLTSGTILLSVRGDHADLLHMLFGDILAIDREALAFIVGVSVATMFGLAALFRALVLDCVDPGFLKASGRGRFAQPVFFVLFVVNLVAAFQALGTLMALGLILLPAIASGFWARRVDASLALSVAFAVVSAYAGLLVSFHANTPSGPTVVFVCGLLCLASVMAGRYGSLRVNKAL